MADRPAAGASQTQRPENDTPKNGATMTLSNRIQVLDDVLCQELGGESVLLDLASQRYFGLDTVGTRIWALLREDVPLPRIVEVICGEYDVEPSQMERDLLALLDELSEKGLIAVATETA